jgi:hypothetical protein
MHVNEDGSSKFLSSTNSRSISWKDIGYQFVLFVRMFLTRFLYMLFYFIYFSRGPSLRHPQGSPFRLILELSAGLLRLVLIQRTDMQDHRRTIAIFNFLYLSFFLRINIRTLFKVLLHRFTSDIPVKNGCYSIILLQVRVSSCYFLCNLFLIVMFRWTTVRRSSQTRIHGLCNQECQSGCHFLGLSATTHRTESRTTIRSSVNH